MAPSAEDIRKTVERYIEAVATGTADDVVALYAEGATVEDPVGTEPRTSVESLREFYAVIEPLKQTGELLTLKIAGNSAAFHFSLVTDLGEQKLGIAPIDVMTFDDDGKITSMRAFWSQEDMITS
ncbi:MULTISPECIES: nuclear transport factor 2 family protein [unclassified Rhodococcus (in: high G+C Gram-positive bacteria)]|uniref:nuclear transport factor 2 family protein n=1 Tax=unclassified Rhodococcus (in: high G+C Gram-positive bacteria) TaxID=192944 RepID=UPI00163ACD14|nr:MULTISPECIES: nuclear transport factor 2 family protein [unclassified Rhodococcus (in: high G+C Gram-positive bacteria)]MBC2641009.1 nuclear transport factor 2 family protein [Rhodococcus sp. 3A]MBC2894246.1 nuclear transport factor 2 family protein [Rhodococcus sp. 4CII]